MARLGERIRSMDQGIGRILDALEEMGQLADTLVIFLWSAATRARGHRQTVPDQSQRVHHADDSVQPTGRLLHSRRVV